MLWPAADRAGRGEAEAPVKPLIQRLLLTLCTGYILAYYGELMFWATPEREGMNAVGILAVWLVYSILAYPFLCVVHYFKVRDAWAIFLAGAFYGWFEEGLILQTTYGSPHTPFPASISFTALAWHAPIDVWIGWYLVRRVLAKKRPLRTLGLFASLGLFYGLWAVFWWNEPPPAMKAMLETGRKGMLFLRFAGFSFGTTALLALAYWLHARLALAEFKPSKAELWSFGVLAVLYFAFVTVPGAPKALWILPPLMAVTFWALEQNRRFETQPDAIGAFPGEAVRFHYLLLFVIPLGACWVYGAALAGGLRLRTNYVVYYTTTPLGTILWLSSVVRCGWRKRRVQREG